MHFFFAENLNKREICHGNMEFTASMNPAKYDKPLINTMKPGMETSIQCGVFSSEMECFWKVLRVRCQTITSKNGQECLSKDVFPRDFKMGKMAQIKDSKSTLVSKYIRQDTVWSLEQ